MAQLWADWWWALPVAWAMIMGYCRIKTGNETTGQIDLRSYLALFLLLLMLISGQLAALLARLPPA